MILRWSEEKNKILKSSRGLSFEQVVAAIGSDELLGIVPHPSKAGQVVLIVRIEDYVCACPAVPTKDGGYFLKTLYPSRKLKKHYQGGKK